MPKKFKPGIPIGSVCAVHMFELMDQEGYGAEVRIPLDKSSYQEMYLQAPTQTCMLELIKSTLHSKLGR